MRFRHFKFLFLFFAFASNVFGNQLSYIDFKASSSFLSPNQDGYNDEVLFYVILHQNLPIKVKDWEIKIYNPESQIVFIHQPEDRQKLQKEHVIVWNGKDEKGQIQKEGRYEVVLSVFYDYGNIRKDFVIPIEILTPNEEIQWELRQTYIFRLWDEKNKEFLPPKNTAEIYFHQTSFREIRGFLLNHNHQIYYENMSPKNNFITWNGERKKQVSDFSVYLMGLNYTTKEKQQYQEILHGILVLPFEPELLLRISPMFLNSNGYGYVRQEYRKFEILIYTQKQWKPYQAKAVSSNYHQIYCLKEKLFKTKWEFFRDGKEELSEQGIERLLQTLPKNQYCQIIFFREAHQIFDFEKLHSIPVIANLLLFIDDTAPIVSVELKSSKFRPNPYYPDFYQSFQITIKENTFLQEVNLSLYLLAKQEKVFLKSWKLPAKQLIKKQDFWEKEIFWFGDNILNLPLESFENFLLEVEVIDITQQKTKITKTFTTDLYFRKHQQTYLSKIPLSNLDPTRNKETIKNYLSQYAKNIQEEFQSSQKKYFYIYVHSDAYGEEEENLKETEEIAKMLYLLLKKEIPYKQIFFRGWGEIRPDYQEKTLFSSYRNERIELIFTNELYPEEQVNF
ncbi:MAG: hypothetical protein NZ853_04275 [Leptospiraceae bacterium]|nr:hypothetical protein [Leptospiraceae bacterium]MDW7975390.1 hypothetical protein [Leptospiraceae bacterium]